MLILFVDAYIFYCEPLEPYWETYFCKLFTSRKKNPINKSKLSIIKQRLAKIQ